MKFKMDIEQQGFAFLLMHNIAKSNQKETRKKLQRLADKFGRQEQVDLKTEELVTSTRFFTLVVEKIEDVLKRDDLDPELKEVSEKRLKATTGLLETLMTELENRREINRTD